MIDLYKKFNKNKYLILFLCCSSILYIICLLSSQDNDMFFEIVSGRDLLAGNFSTASHLNNFPMLVQQWLYSVTLAIFDKLGYIGHILCVFIQNVILVILSYIFIKMKTNNKNKAIIGSIFALLYCYEYMINIRPQIITAILLVAELILIEKYKEKSNIKYLIGVIPILILAANFHQAVFIYHLLVLLPYIIILKKPYIDFKLLLACPVFLLCSLCTPYGLNGSLYIVKTFLSNSYDILPIQELQSIDIKTFYGIKLLLATIITVVLLYKKKCSLNTGIIIFGIFILSLINARHISILYIGILFIICDINTSNETVKKYFYIYTSITWLFISLISTVYIEDLSIKNDIIDSIQDKNAPVYNAYMDIGGYLEYYGCTKIHVDSRAEAFSENISGIPNILENYYMINTGKDYNTNELANNSDILKIVNNYKYVLSNSDMYINRCLQDNNDWTLIYDTDYYIWENVKYREN